MDLNNEKRALLSANRFANLMLKLQLILVLLYFLIIPLKSTVLTHYVILAGAVLSLYCIANICIVRELDANRFFLVLLLGITALISILLSIRFLRSDLLYSLVCFFFLASMICVNKYLVIQEEFIHFVFWVTFLMALVVSVYSLLPFAYLRNNGTTSPNLTLLLGNSNYTGVLLLNILCLLWAASYGEKNRWVIFPLTAYLLYLVWRSGSRTCILGGVFFTILSAFRSDRPIKRWLVFSCLAMPVGFVPFYLWLYGESPNWGVQILGKSLFTGRENTYMAYLAFLRRPWNWLVGNLCEVGLQNAHNAPLAVLCSLGAVGALLYFGLFYHTIWTNNSAVNHPTARTAVAALLTICVASCGEAAMFLGGFPGVSFMVLFLWLSTYRQIPKTDN